MKTHEVVNDLGIVWKIIKCTFHFTWTFSFQQFPSVQFSVLEVGLKFFDTLYMQTTHIVYDTPCSYKRI